MQSAMGVCIKSSREGGNNEAQERAAAAARLMLDKWGTCCLVI